MLSTNVLIIGGGPAGATAARFLAENGIETILLERDLSYKKPCGGGIPSSAFDELDIPRSIIKKEIRKIRIISPGGDDFEIALKGGCIAITDRGDLDTALRAMAHGRGAELIEGTFVRFTATGRKVISLIRNRVTNEETTIQSDYVIAADGITSRAGSQLKAPSPHHIFTISAHIPPAGFDCCEFWFGSGHASRFYSWVFPSSEFASIGTGSSRSRELTRLLDRFIRRRFNSSLRNFAADTRMEKPRAFKIPVWNKTLFNRDNVLFAGDTAGTVMPVTYEGIYYAMKSGEFAAQALIEKKPENYKRLWNSRFRTRFLLMSKINHLLFKDDETIEKWVQLHKKPEVQEIAMKLWLEKKKGNAYLLPYVNVFKHILKFKLT